MQSATVVFMLLLSFGAEVLSFGAGSSSLARRSSCSLHQLNMKIFDFKKRVAFERYEIPEDYELSVTTLFPIPGSRKKFHRVGRGISAGQGKTCGRGMRGQKSRKGNGKGVRIGFEGGQTALYRRLPKINKPQKGHTKTVYTLIKLSHLNAVADGEQIEFQTLFDRSIVTKVNKGRNLFKVVGGEELTAKNLVVKAHAFTESARVAIEGNGGQCILMSRTRPVPKDQDDKEKAELKETQLAALKARRALKAEMQKKKRAAASA